MRATCERHGRYVKGCPDCPARSARYRRTRVAGLRDGSWEQVVGGEDLEPVRQHVRELLAIPGVTIPLVAAATGVVHQTIYRLLKQPGTRLGPRIAQALGEVTAQACLACASNAMMPSIGASRRLQALAADGWDGQSLSDLCGMDVRQLSHLRIGSHPTVRRTTHDRIRELYDKIQSQTDPSGPSTEAARQAQRRGYLPPERWADEDIDSPGAQPLPPPPETEDHVAVTRQIEDCLLYPSQGGAASLPRGVKRELARHARNRLGWSWDQLAWLLGYKGASAAQYLVQGRPDRPPRKRKKKADG